MSKWLIVCLDGTWNTIPTDACQQSSATNVLRFYDDLAPRSPDGSDQFRRYESGVGTNWWEYLRGGGIGKGIDRHIKEAYRWLAENYSHDDHIAIVGFSRGAYAARSLVGLIRNCWLLDREAVGRAARRDPRRLEYSAKYGDALLALSREAYGIYRNGASSDASTAQNFRVRYAQEVKIRFLGVWDTVGALGIPLWVFQKFLNPSKYGFHDTRLSGIVEHAYHAMAIDEHREDYAVTLWDPKPDHHAQQTLQQCWFAGAHADVGGGYEDHLLADISLRWMEEGAKRAGLGFLKEATALNKETCLGTIHDSYREFLGTLFSRVKERYFRPMGRTSRENIHSAVRCRCAEDYTYRPLNQGFDVLLHDHSESDSELITA